MSAVVITIMLFVYAVSVVMGYFGVRWSHKYRWTLLNPNLLDLVIMFIPITNVLFFVSGFKDMVDTVHNTGRKASRKINLNKFFGVN